MNTRFSGICEVDEAKLPNVIQLGKLHLSRAGEEGGREGGRSRERGRERGREGGREE